jgi:cytochrome c peroxidase
MTPTMPLMPSSLPTLLFSAVLSGLVALGCDDGSTTPAPPAGGAGGGATSSSSAGAGGGDAGHDAYDWKVPVGFPRPRVPADNPMSEAKVELGRRLFYDVRLSGNQTQSCASCHRQDLAFTDGLARAKGSTGEIHPRSAMSLVNVGYDAVLTWANPLIGSLEQQALLPMFGETPVELGLAGKEEELLARLKAEPVYQDLFPKAFPEQADPIALGSLTRAIAAFERTMISASSPYDRYSYGGDPSGLSASALRGRELFFSEKLECFHCHGGFNFADSAIREGTTFHEVMFHNTGLYNIDGKGGYPADNTGVFAISSVPTDMGRFRAPTLRNIAVTAPYMHDGSIATLEEALDHYAAGGRTIASGPEAGVGSKNPFKSELINAFTLSPEEKADVIAFLNSLTDEEFLTSPRLADPWSPVP